MDCFDFLFDGVRVCAVAGFYPFAAEGESDGDSDLFEFVVEVVSDCSIEDSAYFVR